MCCVKSKAGHPQQPPSWKAKTSRHKLFLNQALHLHLNPHLPPPLNRLRLRHPNLDLNRESLNQRSQRPNQSPRQIIQKAPLQIRPALDRQPYIPHSHLLVPPRNVNSRYRARHLRLRHRVTRNHLRPGSTHTSEPTYRRPTHPLSVAKTLGGVEGLAARDIEDGDAASAGEAHQLLKQSVEFKSSSYSRHLHPHPIRPCSYNPASSSPI